MHIILYVLDALRADHLSCYGYHRNTTPNIDKLAQDGVLFENCYTATTWTRPTAATIFTGVYPDVHLTTSRETNFSGVVPRLPEVFQMAGWKTAAFSTMPNVSSDVGFERGFDTYFDLFREPEVVKKRKKRQVASHHQATFSEQEVSVPLAEDINDFLLPWLKDNLDANTFNLVWSIGPHAPYLPPVESRKYSDPSSEIWPVDLQRATGAERQKIIDLYDDEIIYNDQCLGKIVEFLQENNVYDDAVILVVGDHGEAFYEHGNYSHGAPPYEELIHVPMVVKLPQNTQKSERVTNFAELVDIFPTLISAADVVEAEGKLDHLQGVDLTDESRPIRKQVYSHTNSPNSKSSAHFGSVRSHKWKYLTIDGINAFNPLRQLAVAWRRVGPKQFIPHFLNTQKFHAQGEYLFDIERDPNEKQNLVKKYPQIAAQMRSELQAWRDANTQLANELGNEAMAYEEDDNLRQHLEALGYL